MIYWLGCRLKIVRWLYWKLSGHYYMWGLCGFTQDNGFGCVILEEPPEAWKDLMDSMEDFKYRITPIYKPQANHSSLFDGTEFCGDCGKIVKYGHRTAFKKQLDCECNKELDMGTAIG